MSLKIPELETVIDIVRRISREILLLQSRRTKQLIKDDGSILTKTDLAMQNALHDALYSNWLEIAFLGEEMTADAQQRLLNESGKGLWVVDPIDGTSNFSLGIPFYAVSLAYLYEGEILLGLVYDPERDEAFYASKGGGALLNGEVLDLSPSVDVERITIGLVDYKRLDNQLARKLVDQPPYKSQRSFGSVALDWCWIAAGRGDVYVHGKQKLWDYAAGCLILEEAGGCFATLTGEEVYDRSLAPKSVVAAINPKIFKAWQTFLKI